MGRAGKKVWWSLILILVLATETHAVFRLEPVESEYIDSIGSWGGCARGRFQKDLKSDKLPEGARNARLGRIGLDFINPILFAVYAEEEGKPLYSIVFDLNGDEDLTNDPSFTGLSELEPYFPNGNAFERGSVVETKEIELTIPNGPPSKMRVILKSDMLVVQTNLWLRGKTVLDGKEWDTAISCTEGGFVSENKKRGLRFCSI